MKGLRWSDITAPDLFLSRRAMLAAMGTALYAAPGLTGLKKSAYSISDKPNTIDEFTKYNNYYEFGTRKTEPAENARNFRTDPWTLTIGGLVSKARSYGLDDIRKLAPLEERIYRFRCVEAWSAIVPWVGYPLSALIQKAQPTSKARYVAFETYYDPAQMPLAKGARLDFPYVEGLRLDEALHPLTLLAVGLYDQYLPPQNGAPVRLVVPWKYGFKSVKSIVKITLTEQRPPTSWNLKKPQEYGFYANVNPAVDHPRWSQASERRLGEFARRPTLPFNGYASEVASLYSGIDLAQEY